MSAISRWSFCLVFILGLVAVALIEPARFVAVAAAPTPEYSRWIGRYQGKATVGYFGSSEKVPLKLIVTAIEGDESKPENPGLFNREISYGSQISTDGRIGGFYNSAMGHKGGGYPKLSAADFKRLSQLLEKLPEDGGVLPPPNRRLVFQISDGENFQVRVYDRANAPDLIWEILRLCSGIRSFVSQFAPTAKWTAHGQKEGALTVSPDGKQIVSAAWYESIKFWNPQTQHSIKRLDAGKNFAVRRIAISPNGSLIALEEGSDIHVLQAGTGQEIGKLVGPTAGDMTYSLMHSQFMRDGRFLLARTSEPSLKIFDIKTGKRLAPLPGMPPKAVAYFPTPDEKFAIYSTKAIALALWDSARKRDVALLDPIARPENVAFSPDGAQVEIATSQNGPGVYWRNRRLRVWSVQSGALLHELRPFEQRTDEAIEGVLWSPEGRYVLAATKSDSFFTSRGISIWNAQSGRHRGELTGPITNVNGLALLGDGQIVAGCDDGVIRLWNLQSALAQIARFEQSLTTK
jgi:WD40 repeat protein